MRVIYPLLFLLVSIVANAQTNDEIIQTQRDCLTEYHICIEAIPFIDGTAERECLEKYYECVNLLELWGDL